MKLLKEIWFYKCERCAHEWVPRKDDTPIICPECKSPYWDKAKSKAGKLESTSIKIDRDLWKLARKQAVDKGLNYSEYLGQLIMKDLGVQNENN